jgi:hypothetical protein
MTDSNKAIVRRRSQEPDIAIGPLAMWVGTGDGQSWPWIDVAVRIGTGWDKLVDLHGGLLQRPDLLGFAPAMGDFVERRRNDVLLASLGGLMRLMLRRSESGSLHGEAWFSRGAISQTTVFGLWDAAVETALDGVEQTVQRLRDAQWGWTPSPELLDPLQPRDSGIDAGPEEDRRPAGPWDAGLGAGEDVSFDYQVDGYGWYGIDVRVGSRSGSFGGGYLTDPMGDLMRAGLAMLAGAGRAELMCNSEPGETRVEFERVLLASDDSLPAGARSRFGCTIRIVKIDYLTGEALDTEFEALCRSPYAVAEAIYRMALPHFREGAGHWSDELASLEGALVAIRRGRAD